MCDKKEFVIDLETAPLSSNFFGGRREGKSYFQQVLINRMFDMKTSPNAKVAKPTSSVATDVQNLRNIIDLLQRPYSDVGKTFKDSEGDETTIIGIEGDHVFCKYSDFLGTKVYTMGAGEFKNIEWLTRHGLSDAIEHLQKLVKELEAQPLIAVEAGKPYAPPLTKEGMTGQQFTHEGEKYTVQYVQFKNGSFYALMAIRINNRNNEEEAWFFADTLEDVQWELPF